MSKKVLLITGGSRGIGAAVAKLAVADGYKLAINYVSDNAAADALVSQLKGQAIAIRGDVAQLADVERMFREAEAAFGPVSHVVNAAGITGKSSRLDAADPRIIADAIAINLTGTILVAREAVKRMSTKHGGKGGVILNISSAASTMGSPGEYTWYAASKAGVETFTMGLAKEVALEGIRVVAVTPGLIDTEIHTRSSEDGARVARVIPVIPMQRIGQAEEVAQAVLFLLSDKASYITGTSLRVSGGR